MHASRRALLPLLLFLLTDQAQTNEDMDEQDVSVLVLVLGATAAAARCGRSMHTR